MTVMVVRRTGEQKWLRTSVLLLLQSRSLFAALQKTLRVLKRQVPRKQNSIATVAQI
jgi:hypothetical protein